MSSIERDRRSPVLPEAFGRQPLTTDPSRVRTRQVSGGLAKCLPANSYAGHIRFDGSMAESVTLLGRGASRRALPSQPGRRGPVTISPTRLLASTKRRSVWIPADLVRERVAPSGCARQCWVPATRACDASRLATAYDWAHCRLSGYAGLEPRPNARPLVLARGFGAGWQ